MLQSSAILHERMHMGIECKDIIKLSKLKDLKLVGGENGLERNIRWVYIAECVEDANDIVNWISGNELIVLTGYGLKGDTNALLELINRLFQKNVAGIIINIGPYFPCVPKEVTNLADVLSLPIFELPWQVKLVDITQEICSAIVIKEIEKIDLENLLENILFSHIPVKSDIIQLAMHRDIDLKDNCVVGVLEIDNFTEYLTEKGVVEESKICDIKNYFLNSLKQAFSRFTINALTMSKNKSVIFLIKYNPDIKAKLPKILDEVRETLSKRFSGICISAGIGNSYKSIDNLRESYKQAEQALKVLRCQSKENNTYFYEDLGIYLILMKIDDLPLLDKLYNDMFTPIIEYDKSTNSKLLETFETYLDENCNIDKTSRKLFIHKNTLKYRLERIEKLLECDINDFQQLVKYEIGFKIGRFKNIL